jgi:hypothetical protein
MGLNDLTLEKLIGEINGYKEKMRAIHEDYGRASADLQDRINVLGYTLNEHLKETKDQIANTPQRLLNLETKYVTGEVNESEYRSQREEFKGLLLRNLHSIEEIRQMIEVLSQIESKPLAPAEFKQNYPTPTRPMAPVEWPKNTITTAVLPSQTLETINPKTISDPVAPEAPQVIVSIPSIPAPTQPSPQTNGTIFLNPQTNNASVQDNIVAQAPADTITAPSTFSAGTSSTDSMIDDSSAGPASDVAEDIADALVVKVVDDMPTVEASAATVLSPDPSQVQTVMPSAESVPGLQPSPDFAKAGLTTPTQFYKVVCPKCGADVPKPAKVWELKGGKSKKNVLIGLFQCQDCRVKFREALTREIL